MDEDINRKLFVAAIVGQYDQVYALISSGASPQWTDSDGWSALHLADDGAH